MRCSLWGDERGVKGGRDGGCVERERGDEKGVLCQQSAIEWVAPGEKEWRDTWRYQVPRVSTVQHI